MSKLTNTKIRFKIGRTVYIDQLLNRLEKCGLGCCTGAYNYGAFRYADDLTLLILTVNGLQKW